MKVLIVTNMYPTSKRPSYGVFVQRQVEALREIGHQVNVKLLDGSECVGAYAAGFLRVPMAARLEEYDLVHSHYGLTGFVCAFPRPRRLVISLCGDDVLGTPSTASEAQDVRLGDTGVWASEKRALTLKSRIVRRLSRIACARADQLIVKSAEMARVIEGWGFPGARVIPNGVDLSFFQGRDAESSRAARKRRGLASGKRYILFPSDPYEIRKRVDLARTAVKELCALGHDAELLVVHGLAQEILRDYYLAADLLLLTSEWEGSPNVLKEAMACNLPSVSFDVGDVNWLCSGTRFHRVVSRLDTDHMIREADGILNSGSFFVSDGRMRVEKELSSRAVAERISEVYRLCVG